jgi:hypothetical protein
MYEKRIGLTTGDRDSAAVQKESRGCHGPHRDTYTTTCCHLNPRGVRVHTVTPRTTCFRHLGVTKWFPLERHGAGVTPLCQHLLDSLCPLQMWLYPPWLDGANLCSGPLCRRSGLSPVVQTTECMFRAVGPGGLAGLLLRESGTSGCSTFSVPPAVSRAGLAEGASEGNAPVR